MKTRNFGEIFKNAAGTVFLLAAAFFVCSTFLSMRAVFADPVAPQNQILTNTAQARRTGAQGSGATRGSPRANTGAASRTGGAVSTPSSAGRTVSGRSTASRGTGQAASSTDRNIVSRANSANSRGTVARSVVARSGTTDASQARVSLTGSAIRGSKTSTSAYTYLSNKLYTGNYSNIIDSTTGLISAEAYSNCLESYYTCMDEICTARNAAQRRCACAGRVKAFADAESKLETANEELIKVSGELALLIATKGKDISAAFQLTDAEKVMNCVSWQDESTNDPYWSKVESGETLTGLQKWCQNHMLGTDCAQPKYCSESGNTFGFDIKNLNGSSSDILASLKSWADAKDKTLTITGSNNDSLLGAFQNTIGALSGMGIDITNIDDTSNLKDSLAETWGYELFEYAHNNVCNRVLDSCFNGIYEACGTPKNGQKCYNNSASCPYNYNSYITVNNSGTYELNFVTPNTGTSTNSATCFGYTSTAGDPYQNLRGPVADSRRSILQKYALDANADCDAYGEQLKTTAQNIGYQKAAAQQALQQKRLEFAQEEITTIASDFRAAKNNFNECLSELYDCYTTQETSNTSWSTSRIKTYCSQVSNVASCYETMVCGAPNNLLEAVITKTVAGTTTTNNITTNTTEAGTACSNTTDASTNTCRNVVTIAEVLSGSYASGAVAGSSVEMREKCLQNIGIDGVRNWSSKNSSGGWSAESCQAGQHLEGTSCVPDTRACTHTDSNAATAQLVWNSNTGSWSGCQLLTCKSGYTVSSGACVQI
ncbi:MAG: hypothetical protein LBD50_01705 [Rickettsiales bacterium]|jgi:hypothetical protein|nr:hypothetical protein [Rickettsiales bacterium]